MNISKKGNDFREKLENRECENLEPYALKSKKRYDELKENFREYKEPSRPEFRTEYHRDRDRILWSKTFKRLQHKTQVFPHYVEDHYKRRLTHSLEVSQIATTIARSLGLNEIATEAIALGHDLGHAPFGHAGERALNEILKNKKSKPTIDNADTTPIPIFGFDHCVHGIEVISRIEKVYQASIGLNLTFDVRDGILKHMYDREISELEERPFSLIQEVVRFPQYKIYENNKGTLEAQCVYFADKIAYLLGDLEDGIRSGILRRKDIDEITQDEFYKMLDEKYKNFRKVDKGLELKDISDFESFRSKALTTLILDCIENTEKNLNKNKFDCVRDVLSSNQRIVFFSDDLRVPWDNFYSTWMEGNLFIDKDVTTCSFKAKTIISDLFKAYDEDENLITKEYREHCKKVYNEIGITDNKLLKLILVRNYIAGMTDAFATDQHSRLYMSSERVIF